MAVLDRPEPGSTGGHASTGDRWSALFESHYRELVGLASFSVDDRETAEEVVQDVFVKVLGGNYSVEPGKELAYLRSMVVNGGRSQLRRRRVRRLHSPAVPEPVAAAEIAGLQGAERAELVAALRTLPDNQAAVLALRYFLDLSEAEIAETLGMAKGTVKSHAHRGLQRLASRLGVHTEGGAS